MRPQRKSFAVAGLSVLLAAASLWGGRLGVVTTLDGQTSEGEVTERQTEVVVRRNGIDSVFEKDNVASIDYTPYADRFKASLAKLEAEDVDGRVALARDAFERREYALSLQALQAALDIEPLNRDARQLQALVGGQVQLEGQSGRPAADPATRPAAPAEPRAGRRPRGLSDAQVSRVRIVELRKDDRVRIQFRDNVRKRFVDSQTGMDFRSFAKRNDIDQAFAIVEKGGAALAEDVVVASDPSSIQSFAKKLQVAIVQGCASSNCHGGAGGGAFRLLGGTPDPSATVTNFYLLNAYVQKLHSDGGIFDAETAAMVDRGNGKNSVLVQYALPQKLAKLKHPAVRGWDGLVRDANDKLVQDMIHWMDVELVRLPTPYGFTFALPSKGGAATSPTTEPAAAASTAPSTAPSER